MRIIEPKTHSVLFRRTAMLYSVCAIWILGPLGSSNLDGVKMLVTMAIAHTTETLDIYYIMSSHRSDQIEDF